MVMFAYLCSLLDYKLHEKEDLVILVHRGSLVPTNSVPDVQEMMKYLVNKRK